MTKSKFKYSTANAGATLFQPKKESKPFAPFDIQAAGQHIIAAKEQNMRTELGNIKRTGDEGAEDFDIEQKNRLIVEQQNAYVEKINDQYDYPNVLTSHYEVLFLPKHHHLKETHYRILISLLLIDDKIFH